MALAVDELEKIASILRALLIPVEHDEYPDISYTETIVKAIDKILGCA